MEQSAKKRIGFIDAMRGMTMFLVVVAHVMTFGLGINAEKSILGSVLITFRMPVFFLISGFVAYKTIEKFSTRLYFSTIWKKVIALLVPTIVFFCFACIIKGSNPMSEFMANGFKEYWFMIVLFEIFLIYLTFSLLLKLFGVKDIAMDIVLIALVVLSWYLYFNEFFYINTGIRRVFSIGKLVNYFQYFAVGVFFRKYWQHIHTFFRKDLVKTLAIVLFSVLMIVIWKTHWTASNILSYKIIHEVVVRYMGLIVFFIIFLNQEKYFESNGKFSNILKLIGKRTMDIYLIHYFFLPDIKFLTPSLAGNINIALEILVVVVMSALIIGVSLGVSYILRRSSFLAHYLFGEKR